MRGPDPSYLGAEQVLSLGYDNNQDEKRFIGQLLILSVKTGSPCHQWPWARYVTNAQSHAPQACLFCGVQGAKRSEAGRCFCRVLANVSKYFSSRTKGHFPSASLLPGYRHIHLLTKNGDPYSSSTLFVYINIQDCD